jgi:hypothetical protein
VFELIGLSFGLLLLAVLSLLVGGIFAAIVWLSMWGAAGKNDSS